MTKNRLADHGRVSKWSHSLDFGQPMIVMLQSDGSISGPVLAASWRLEGNRIALAWQHSGEERG